MLKGVVETLLETLHVSASTRGFGQTALPLLEPDRQGRLELDGQLLGYLGEVSAARAQAVRPRVPTTVLELDLGVLEAAANLVPQQQSLSDFPAIVRDLNLIVDESVRWADLAPRFARRPGRSWNRCSSRRSIATRRRTEPTRNGCCSRSRCGRRRRTLDQ